MNLLENKFAWLIAAGLSGSLVGLGIDKAEKTPFQRFMYLFGGFACSFFLAGPISKYFGLSDPGEIAAVGFAVAIFWQTIVSKIGSVIEGIRFPTSKGGSEDVK